jgi:subfamily B ATP-binding cassette protein MsbA
LVVQFLVFTREAYKLFRRTVPRFTSRLVLVVGLEFVAALSSSISIALLAPFLQQLTGSTQEGGPYAVLQRALGVTPTLVTMSGLFFLAVLLRNGLSIGSTAVQSLMAAQLTHRLRSEVFSAYVNSDLRFFAKAAEGKAISAFTGEIERTRKVLSVWRRGISSVLYAITYLGVLLVISPAVTLGFLAVGALLLAGLMNFYYRLRQEGLLVSRMMDRLNGKVSDMIHSFVAIKSVGAEDHQTEAFKRDSWEYARADRRQALLTVLPGLVLEGVFYAGVLVVLLYVYRGYIAVGTVSAFTVITYLIFAGRLVETVIATSGVLSQLFHDAPGFERIREAINVRPVQEIVYGDRVLERVGRGIAVEHVSLMHDGEPVLDDVSFEVPAGQIVAVVGPSGSGKSTLALLLAGLYRPDKGEIRIDGIAVSEFTRSSLIRAIAFQPQEARLFSGSIRDNLTFGLGRPASEQRIDAALEQAQLTELVDRRDRGEEGSIGEKGAALSGGERQRILFGRALLREPSVLVLDEVTSALDLGTEARILDVISSLRGRQTVIFITHRLRSAKIADRIVVMEKGRVVEQGTFDELLRRDEAFARLYRRE